MLYQKYDLSQEKEHDLRRKRFYWRDIYFIVLLPATAGVSVYGCEGADCHDLKWARFVVWEAIGADGSVIFILSKWYWSIHRNSKIKRNFTEIL